MFEITKSVDIDFAHHISGHAGNCINIHGHTWKFEITLGADELNDNGFVVDFGILKSKILEPIKALLDHSLVLSDKTFKEIEPYMLQIGATLISTRPDVRKSFIDTVESHLMLSLNSATLWECAGINITTFAFTPTSEQLAKWLYNVAENIFILDNRVVVKEARVYEQLHPVEACAVYRR